MALFAGGSMSSQTKNQTGLQSVIRNGGISWSERPVEDSNHRAVAMSTSDVEVSDEQ
jgi:hypothetical protein